MRNAENCVCRKTIRSLFDTFSNFFQVKKKEEKEKKNWLVRCEKCILKRFWLTRNLMSSIIHMNGGNFFFFSFHFWFSRDSTWKMTWSNQKSSKNHKIEKCVSKFGGWRDFGAGALLDTVNFLNFFSRKIAQELPKSYSKKTVCIKNRVSKLEGWRDFGVGAFLDTVDLELFTQLPLSKITENLLIS